MQSSPSSTPQMARWKTILPALRELGVRQVGLYALYQFGLHTGHYRRVTDPARANRQAEAVDPGSVCPLWQLPALDDLRQSLGEPGLARLIAQADEIVSGQVRLFGGPPVPLQLVLPSPLVHWTEYERGVKAGDGDIKWIWEPGRLGWVYTLGRAYLLYRDERYSTAFWRFVAAFLDANPPYQGPHWISAQEAAVRLIALTFGWQVFGCTDCANSAQAARLVQAVAVHAARIPPTLAYARSQNNNHLLTEAAGLYTAGWFLPDHPQAKRWRGLGWRWFNHGIQSQIASDGAYIQHSTNYHRLMLQIALWMSRLAESQGEALPGETRDRLAAATRWLSALVDPQSGHVPNLGPNDGAYILPFTICLQEDYRPVLQAAASVFFGAQLFAPGPWDEMASWFGGRNPVTAEKRPADWKPGEAVSTPHVLRSPDGDSWAYLRAARFAGRPGHADQLHLDLWWRGLNVAQDAGTYLYNAPPPWDNSLASTSVHNTLVINGLDQMRRVGRFLFLGRAQAEILRPAGLQDNPRRWISARHDGYRRLGLWHQRDVNVDSTGNWEIIDTVYPIKPPASDQPQTVRLHWLLPDWQARVDAGSSGIVIELGSPFGLVQLHLEQDQAGKAPGSELFQIVRAGELHYGSGAVSPVWGWVSPTYGVKVPAVSVRYTVTRPLFIRLRSRFIFPPSSGVEKV